MRIGAIADDITGATDLGLMFARGGLRVVQCIGVPDDGAELGDAQAVVVALKSRTIPAHDAVAQSVEALHFLAGAGASQFLFKYCSTFDSTAEGNIGPVVDALMDALGETATIACPAMPANGRTVYQGHLFVGDTLLSESSMKDHPLTPMRDANLVRVLARQSRNRVSLVAHPVVRAGGEVLEQAFAAIEGIAIADAVDEADLVRLGHAARSMRLVTGGSGLALGLAANFPREAVARGDRSITPSPGGAVVIAGSCSVATRGQIAIAQRAGAPVFRITTAALARADIADIMVEDAVRFAETANGAVPPIIYSSAEPAEIEAAQRELGRDVAGELVEQFLGEVARRLLAGSFTRFVVAGGETSGAVTHALGARKLTIGPEIDPGVPWTSFSHGGRTIALALKSGNFGADDFLLKAWTMLR